MKVKCEYCHSIVDVCDGYKCSNCGANIESIVVEEENRIEMQKNKLQLEQEENESKITEERLKTEKSNRTFLHVLKIACLVPAILLFIVISIALLKTFRDVAGINSKEEKEVIIENRVEGNFNEVVKTSSLGVICDSYEEFTKGKYLEPSNGYKYMRFHFIVENISNNEIYDDNKVIALVNGIQCSKVNFSDVKKLPVANIMPGSKIDGYMAYEIPIDAKEVDIKYGEYITIHIDIK